MIRLQHERDVETLRQIGILLDNENKRLVERNRKLTLELARALGLDDKQREQLELSLLQELKKSRDGIFEATSTSMTKAEPPKTRRRKGRSARGTDLVLGGSCLWWSFPHSS